MIDTEMIKREVILPKLNDANGDLSKQWFVYFSVLNPATGRLKTFRKYEGFTPLTTVPERRKHATKLIRKWKLKLLSGWNPFFEMEKVKYASLIRYETDARLGKSLIESTKNFEYYSTRYLDFSRNIGKIRPASYTTYKSKLRIFSFFLVDKGLDKVNVRFFNIDTINEFNKWLSDTRELTGKSMNDFNTTLARFFKYLIVEEKVLNVNPCESCRSYAEEKTHHLAYNPYYIQKLKEALQFNEPWMWLNIQIMVATFIRPKELRFLQIKHFDFTDGTIHLPAEVAKNKIDRIMTLPEGIYKELLEKGFHTLPAEYYFTTAFKEPGPNPASKNFLYNRMSKLLIQVGAPKGYTLYGLKHTGVQRMVRANVPLMYVKSQLGHASYDQMLPYVEELMTQGNDEIRKNVQEL